MNQYTWKAGACLSGDPQVVGEVCANLEKDGKLTAANLVDVSRPQDAPLHAMFEWDDAVAAEAYREVQGGRIIRSVEVIPAGTSEPTRAFVSVETVNEGRNYISIEKALRAEDARSSLLIQARRDMDAFVRKYSHLKELAGLIGKITAARDMIS